MSDKVVELMKRRSKMPNFCVTKTAEGILTFLEDRHQRGSMGAIVGPPGCGKTMTAQYYAATADRVYYAKMSMLDDRPGRVLRTLGRAMKIRDDYPSPYQLYAHMLLLREHGLRYAVLVDEAQHLSFSALEMLRDFHDESGCAVILIGNPHVITQFNGVKGSLFAHFLSRVGPPMVLGSALPEDVEAICDHHGVHRGSGRQCLVDLGTEPGGLRIIGKIIERARKAAAGGVIETRHIEEAMTFLQFKR